jgi:circadian clock protein KaiC
MSTNHQVKKLERLSTGDEKLDAAMDGGFPVQSVSVIAGEPGSGKTVLAIQMMFAAARAGKKCLYFTTLSEPSLKLMRYMQLFDFFDQTLVDQNIVIHDIGKSLRAHNTEIALSEIVEQVEQHEPFLVVVDSFKAIHDLVAKSQDSRTFTYDLAVQIASWGATTILVGEYTEDEAGRFSEFAIADGIVRMGIVRQELACIRELEIRKLRGSTFTGGIHFFEISSAGISFFPRVRVPELEAKPTSVFGSSRIGSGVPQIDELFRGGIPEGSTSLVMGGAGTGKTLLGMHFAIEGARRGEPCVYFTLEETVDQLRAIGDSFGFDFTGLEKKELLHLRYTAPVELSTDRFLNQARELVEAVNAKRAVLDSLSSISLGAVTERRYKELIYSLAKYFRQQGVSLLATLEIGELLGTAKLSGHGVSFAADNVIQLRYVEMEGRLERAISVIKARGVNLNTEVRPFRIGNHGMEVGGPEEFRTMRGVITGLPVEKSLSERGPK